MKPVGPGLLANVLRAAAMGMAALSLTWGIALSSGLVAAVAGAALGVPAGVLLGRSRLRLPVALAVVGIVFALSWALAFFAVSATTVPLWLGTGRALGAAAALRFGATAFAISAALRTLSVRRPAAGAVELLALAAAIPTVFAAHRDGVIARPLWLSDYAWQRGIDPTQIFLGIGAGAVAVLAVLLLAESRSGRALSALFALFALLVGAVLLLPLLGMPTPRPPDDLGLTNGSDGGASSPKDLDGGQGARPDQGDAGDPLDAGRDLSDGGEVDWSLSPQGQFGDGGLEGGTPIAPSEHLDDATSGGGGGEAPMAVVILDEDYSPPAQAYYFRQEVWSQFNGTRLVRATRSDVDRDIEDTFPAGDVAVLDPPPEDGRTRVHATVVLVVDHSHPFALESAVRFSPSLNPNPTRFSRAYRFESLAQSVPYKDLFDRKAGNPAWPAAVRDYYLEGPSDPRYRDLAKAIEAHVPASHKGDPFATALTVKLYLDDKFIYSTKHHHAGAADPTADFLFGDRTGYCVHFAHAAVLLWRALGIPARISTGYRSDEDNRHGSSTILIRGADAHAWPEIYLEGVGWVVLDIAAKQSLDPTPPPVDPDLQRLLGEMARKMPPSTSATALEDDGDRARYGRELLRLSALLAGIAVVVLYVTKIWRRVAPWVSRPARLPFVGYRSALDMLSEVGLSREVGETREAFAERVGERAPSFAAVTAMHLAAALGDPERGMEGREEYSRRAWRDGVRGVRRELRGAAKWWRRGLGVLHPGSFLRSR